MSFEIEVENVIIFLRDVIANEVEDDRKRFHAQAAIGVIEMYLDKRKEQ